MTDGVPGLQVLVFPIVYFLFYYYGMSLVLERRNGVELLTGRGYYLPVSGFQLQIRMSRNKWKKKEWQRKQSQDLITPGPFNRTSLPSFLMHVESSFPFVDHHLSSLFLTASSPIFLTWCSPSLWIPYSPLYFTFHTPSLHASFLTYTLFIWALWSVTGPWKP